MNKQVALLAAGWLGLLFLSSRMVAAAPVAVGTPTPTPTPVACVPNACAYAYSGVIPEAAGLESHCPGCGWGANTVGLDLTGWGVAGSRWTGDNWAQWGSSCIIAVITAWDETPGGGGRENECAGWLELFASFPINFNQCGTHTYTRCLQGPPPWSDPWHISLTTWLDSGAKLEQLTVQDFRFLEPHEECSLTIDAGATTGNINATDEVGVSESVITGQEYILEISGGPWHDSPGGADRYDVVISWDGATWESLEAAMASSGCIEYGDTYVRVNLVAESDTLSLRVNDIDGAFADNDGSMSYQISSSSPSGSYCGNYFQNEQWFASGIVFADDSAGRRFPPDPGFGTPYSFTPGQYYKFEVGSGWTEGDGSTQLGAQIMDPDNGIWIDMANWAYTVCADATGTIYFRPNKTFYYIRVDDQDGIWSNNSGSLGYNLYTADYRPPPNPCDGLYDLQNWIDSAIIPASDASGSPVPSDSSGQRLQGGYYYFLEQTGPQWSDGGVSVYDLQISDDRGQTWYDPEDWPMALCVSHDDQGRYKIFFQANTTQIWVRAGDYNNNWMDNTGHVSYNLYFAGENSPPPGGNCASEYQLIQDPNSGDVSIVEQGAVPANAQNGSVIGASLVTGKWYAIDASMEYWFDNAFPRNEYDLGDGINWWLAQNYPGAACAEIVNNQWVRVYFRYQGTLQLRAHDPMESFSDNTGNVTYRIMPVFHRTPPPPSACYQNYELTLEETGKLYANLEQGQDLNVTPGSWALETVPPGWTEGDGTVSHQIDISDDGGVTWYPLEMAPFADCIIATDSQGNYRIYWTFIVSGAGYKIRVHDLDNDFGNNQGYIGYLLFSTTETGGTTGTGCDELFTNPELVDSGVVDASNEQGNAINLVPGYWYRIDTSGPAWQNAGVDSWDVALTNDGANWELVDPNSTLAKCAWYPDGVHVRAYFQVMDGDTWKIRAHDPGGYYADNTGSVQYAIYRVNYQETVVLPPPPPFSIGCDAVCTRPDSAINVPAWLEYGSCRLIKFISFCPYHEAALSGIMQNFFNREPFATINEIRRDALPQIQTEVNSYDWSSDQQEMGGLTPNDILSTPPADSPWNGGHIQILGPQGTYNLACQNGLANAVGTQMAKSLCFGLSIMREKGVLGWFQLILDITAITIGALYIWKQWIEPAMS